MDCSVNTSSIEIIEVMCGERKRVAHTPNWSKKTVVSERQEEEALSQEQLWARLDELEKQEQERMELGTESPLPSESENVPSEGVPVENRITFQHTPSVSSGTVVGTKLLSVYPFCLCLIY